MPTFDHRGWKTDASCIACERSGRDGGNVFDTDILIPHSPFNPLETPLIVHRCFR